MINGIQLHMVKNINIEKKSHEGCTWLDLVFRDDNGIDFEVTVFYYEGNPPEITNESGVPIHE